MPFVRVFGMSGTPSPTTKRNVCHQSCMGRLPSADSVKPQNDCRWQSFCDLTESPDKNRPCGINIYRNIILTAVTIITEPNTILSHRTEIFDNSFAPSAPPISPPNVTGSHSEKSNQPPRMYKTELTADIKKITAIAVACDFFSSISKNFSIAGTTTHPPPGTIR